MLRILGVDPSSSSSGVAIIENGVPVRVDVHKPNTKLDLGERLHKWALFLDQFRAKQKLDLVAIEKLTMFRNKHSSRMICYFGAVPLQVAGKWKVPTEQYEVKTIRKQAFGHGGANKEQIYFKYSKMIGLKPFDKGGNDESDAIAVGICAHKLLQ